MKKRVLKFIGFMTGLFVLLVISSHIFAPKEEIYNTLDVNRKINEIRNETDNSIDVIFLGDSETYSAFSPLYIWEQNSFTSYICGSSAQRLCDTWQILKGAYENQSPKVVVLETNCLFRNAGYEPKGPDKGLIYAQKCFSVFKYHNRWKTTVQNRYFADDSSSDTFLKGFKVRHSVVPYSGKEYMQETTEVEALTDNVTEYLDKIKEFCDEKGAKLVLVSVIAPTNCTYARHNGICQWTDKNKVDFVDMNLLKNEIGIDYATDYKDGGNHLNFQGAKKVSAYFGNYLDANYNLDDCDNEEVKTEWVKRVSDSKIKFSLD